MKRGFLATGVVVVVALQEEAYAKAPSIAPAASLPRLQREPPVAVVPMRDAPPPTMHFEDHMAVPKSDWRALVYVGGYASSGNGGGTLGASFQYRAGFLAAGPLFEVGVGPGEYFGAAAAAGFAVRPRRDLRFELLGTVGVHSYHNVGGSPLTIFGGDPGAGGTTGYAGGRAAVGYRDGSRANHFEIGAYADYQNDFSRQRVVYEYSASIFGRQATGDHVVGFSRLGFGLELAGVHDIM